MPVAAPSAPKSASRCATTEPLPLVPATVITGNSGASIPSARATAATRVSSRSMLFGCTASCSVSHSASVRMGADVRSRRGLQAAAAGSFSSSRSSAAIRSPISRRSTIMSSAPCSSRNSLR